MTSRQPAAAPHRILDQVVRGDGEHQRDRDEDGRPERADATRRTGLPQHDQRPVPQIPGVGDVSYPGQRRDREDASRPHPVSADPRGDQGRGAQDREQSRRPWEPGGRIEGEDGDQHARESAGRQDPANPGGRALETRHREGQERADAELPGTTWGGEVRRRLVGTLQMERPHEGGGDQSRHGCCHPAPSQGGRSGLSTPARDHHEPDQEHRPHEVELLLDRQRPVVLQGRRRQTLGEVVGSDRREPDVREERGGPGGIGRHVTQSFVREL